MIEFNFFEMKFKDRQSAGLELATILKNYSHQPETIVIGLPRGGVMVAFSVAQKLGLPLEITIPRKIGAPFHSEFAIGAISEEGIFFPNQEALKHLNVETDYLKKEITKEIAEAQRRRREYGGNKELVLTGKTVIIVDDGMATGVTMVAALDSLRKRGAKKTVIAVPVLPADLLKQKWADEIIYLLAPQIFRSVGEFYENFEPVLDSQVKKFILQSKQ